MKFGKIEGNDYNNLIMNDAINAFRIAVGDNISLQEMVDMFVDEYEDETGIDTGSSINILYDSTYDYYSMGEGDTTTIDNMEYANDGDAQTAYVTSTPINNVLLLHFDGSDEATSTTDATGRHGTITFNETAQLDDADKKWGTTSLLLDGNSDYLTIPDSADWDVFASATDDWTVDFWVQLEVTTSQTLIEQFLNSDNRWTLYYASAGAGLHFYVKISASNFINMYCDNWFTDTDWHHIAIIKVADEYAVYIDGSQENYTQTSTTGNITAQLTIGKYGGGSSSYLNGHMDEIRIAHSNALNASPNVGKTDTITVPTSAYTLISGTDIMAFSEDTVKEQGSYALKIEAEQTNSLNEILTKTFSTPLDLSNRDVIKFKARATRTGTNFKLHLITDQFGLDITSGQSYLASSTWAQYSVSNCFDNDVASCWTCDDVQTTNQWIRIQFSSPKSINKIRLLNGGWNISETIRYAKIEASNNTSDWIKIPCISWDVCEQYNVDEIKYAQINDTTSWQTVELRNYNSYTYWRVFIYDAYSSTSERIREIEMMEGIQYGYDVAISSANTWETKELDISGIANDDKDVIKYLELEIINADLANTIYLDEMYSYANATGFTLISENQTAVSEPDEARIVVLMEEVSAITLNTDLKAWASKDDGITWAQVTLEDVGDYGDSIKILYGEVDLTQSGIGSGTDIVYRLTTHNNKNCKIHGTSPAWR